MSKNYLMSVEELAKYLKLRKQTIYNWLHKGKITGIKIGKVWRFEKKDIDRWLRERKIRSHRGARSLYRK